MQNITGGALTVNNVDLPSTYTGCTLNTVDVSDIPTSPVKIPAGGEIFLYCSNVQNTSDSVSIEYDDFAGLERTVDITASKSGTSGGECVDGSIDTCPLQADVCSGSQQTCINNNWPGCTAAEYLANNPNYEATETSCADGLDNDCDGSPDCLDSDCDNKPGCPVNYSFSEMGGVTWDDCTDNEEWISDDGSYQFSFESNLGWSLPFYDQEIDWVDVCDNGYIMMDGGYCDYGPGYNSLEGKSIIAPFYADSCPGTGTLVYRCEYGDHVTFRWAGWESCWDPSYTSDFELQVFDNGNAYFLYNGTELEPNQDIAAGISNGDDIYYTYTWDVEYGLPPDTDKGLTRA